MNTHSLVTNQTTNSLKLVTKCFCPWVAFWRPARQNKLASPMLTGLKRHNVPPPRPPPHNFLCRRTFGWVHLTILSKNEFVKCSKVFFKLLFQVRKWKKKKISHAFIFSQNKKKHSKLSGCNVGDATVSLRMVNKKTQNELFINPNNRCYKVTIDPVSNMFVFYFRCR